MSQFRKFLGFPTEGLEEVIYDFMKEVSARRKKGKGKGFQVPTKFERELKKLECNVKDKGRKKGVILGRGASSFQFGF